MQENTDTTKLKEQTTGLQDFTTLPSISLDDLLAEKVPEQSWLVEGRIPANAITIISGQPSSYKTRYTLDIALALASGNDLYGVIPTQQSGVMIIDEESGKWLLHRQLNEQGATTGLPIRVRSLHGFKLTEEHVALLLLDCMAYGLKTVIFDSLSHIHDGNENDASEMTPKLKLLQRLTTAGITVILIHHNRKESQQPSRGGSEVRGSSAIFAIVDAQITLVPKGEDRVAVHQNKLRYAKKPAAYELRVITDEDSFSFEYLGDNPDKQARLGRLADEIKKQLGRHKQLNQKELIQFLKADGISANDRNVPEAIALLKEAGAIASSPGSKRSILYALVPTPSNT